MIAPIKFILYGETPAKKNSRITLQNGRTIPNKRYREWHAGAMTQLQTQWEKLNRTSLNGALKISLHFYHADNRRRDSDNGVSSVFDTLQDANIISDDRWQIVRKFSVNNSKSDDARCEIEIMELEE